MAAGASVSSEGPCPLGPGEEERFYPSKVEEIMETLCRDFLLQLGGYDAAAAAGWAQQLAQQLLAAIRSSQQIPRFKVLVQVLLLQQRRQGICFCSKSLCDAAADNWASVAVAAKDILCCAIAYGFYHE
ncbi:Tctex-1 family domain containing protein, putative [Eimeria tenella]|uniref:Tctex-1 family domain containing protein, putative n=1 Tax=Eimeria tenella TaxID=5802 RepID=U6KZ11_EIMTE|nr:Tctex-1 family domain containing protein, putative [Eimeria tenella]CDJ43201.1 Tctex-1 family domain containing protein, putative [Eimeria tenella]|eukprot:XP_013233951.1 Tctex-1 family domain containing protein, putative [Eimeria tenella]